MAFSVLPAAAQSGRSFYIDYASGSNSNPGTKSAPWKSHPYMQPGTGCTGSGSSPSYSHQAGDRFIFKGGVSWPASCFTMRVAAGGTSGTQDYYGVDQTWFTGGSFTRPKFALAGAAPTGDYRQNVIELANIGFVTLDNIEISGQQCTTNNSDPTTCWGINGYNNSGGMKATNLYIHGYTSPLSNFSCDSCTSGLSGGIYGFSLIDHVTFDNSDGGLTGSGYSPGQVPIMSCSWNTSTFQNSSCNSFANGVLGGSSVHDSTFTNGSSTITPIEVANGNPHPNHTNDIEDTWQDGMVIYNNLIHDSNTDQHVAVAPGGAVYNNVAWNLTHGTSYAMVDNGISNTQNYPSATTHFYNNTFACSSINCIDVHLRGGSTTFGTVLIKNNLWVTPGSSPIYDPSSAPYTATSNYSMLSSEATAHGFTSANKYAPTSSDPATVGQGTNLTSIATGNLAALLFDTGGAPWYGGTASARPANNWTLGAYQSGSTSTSTPKPAAPTGLLASVQ